jgi:tetratricopeptide (TPR) repeat protein
MEDGNLNSWADKWREYESSGNFEEAIEFYTEAARLNPNDDSAFLYWGTAISDLARLKQDESLFRESFEKYDTATRLNPDNAHTFYNWGNAIYGLARLKQDESLFRESFEKYDTATRLKPDDANAFSNWGNAILSVAQLKQDELLFRESFEKYDTATRLKPDYADAFRFWGNAIAFMAIHKQEESLFWESFEKYGTATQLKPDDTDAFCFWGNAIVFLAIHKQDESLFWESFKKFDNATRLKPDSADAFRFWGNAIALLAKHKQDESLFRESFEKYDTATRLKPDDAYAFYFWGNAICNLARLKQDESLFWESFEKYDTATRLKLNDAKVFSNWGRAIYGLAKLNTPKSKDDTSFWDEIGRFERASEMVTSPEIFLIKGELFFLLDQSTKATECFLKSEKEILEIFSFLDKENQESIMNTEILLPLLEPDSKTDDALFFQETIKNRPDKKSYKKIYLLSTLIISRLHVNNEDEQLVAHYSRKTVSQKMLFTDKGQKVSRFRLNAINYSNDPTEGKTLLDYLFGKECPAQENVSVGYGAFAGCFTFDYNGLNQFRLYGKEGEKEATGISLVFRGSFFSKRAKMALEQPLGQSRAEDSNLINEEEEKEEKEKHALFRCIYIDPESQRVETVGHKESYLFYRERPAQNKEEIREKVDAYRKNIEEIVENIRDRMAELKGLVEVEKLNPEIVGQLLINLRYLTKHIAFKEEQECRIVKIHRLNDKNVQIEDYKRMFVEYQEIPLHIKEIYFGPKATEIELFQDILIHEGLAIPCKKSNHPLT